LLENNAEFHHAGRTGGCKGDALEE